MKSKTGDSWAEFFAEVERETDKEIAEVSRQLALSEEEDKALLASLEAEPLPELDLDLDLDLDLELDLLDIDFDW
ncbi:hypothetical protein ACRE9F_16985 [Klebsiella pneumoniae]|uniref:hypothetical protein n=1 Tax=Klebsiella/Raoultella group TaxID=2890311 RepID=UPI000D58D524|nr:MULTISPECIES: hypothetical protein [Klebsiella/Raoultella group]HBC7360931.1 hypothetical protein [Klebsiella oxytoca]HBR1507499.1 hypothetical protein [Klebsiella quasipneumoniae subsp. quasipneumoniae]AXA29233.1 hypothetical protein BBB54_06665 [Klebsiella variicola]EIW5629282.1 hypothetical protein [Klebsiella pneumoniae]MBC4697823.1 hypothetical protein [Klebsiella pneumoniae]